VLGPEALRGLVRARRRPWRKGESFRGRAVLEGVGEERLCRCCGGVVFVAGWCFEGEEDEVEVRDVRVGVAKPVDAVGGVDSAFTSLEREGRADVSEFMTI